MKGKDKTKQFRMIFGKLRNTWRDPSISMQAKTLLFDLMLYGGVDGAIFPSQNRLASDMGVTDRYIRKLLDELISKELIFSFRRGFSKSNEYTINEELYFLNGGRQNINVSGDYGSSMEGTQVPVPIGIPVPAKESQNERTNSKEIHTPYGSVDQGSTYNAFDKFFNNSTNK